MSWSGGKDSAVALHEFLRSRRYEVVALMTSVAAEYRRISHHGVREELLDAQAQAIGLPLEKVYLPSSPTGGCSNDVYEEIMAETLTAFRDRGIQTVAYGDLFLQDIRHWREASLARIGMRAVFPIWGRDTTGVAHDVIRAGYGAYTTCVEAQPGREFVGRLYDADFVAQLPAGVDPCGERGEFHTFVFDGPPFRAPVAVEVGEIVTRDGRFYADLLSPTSGAQAKCVAELIPQV